jgi:hypothetical protein
MGLYRADPGCGQGTALGEKGNLVLGGCVGLVEDLLDCRDQEHRVIVILHEPAQLHWNATDQFEIGQKVLHVGGS